MERGGQGLPVGASPEPRSGKRAGTSAGVRDGTETSALGGCERPAFASENSQSDANALLSPVFAARKAPEAGQPRLTHHQPVVKPNQQQRKAKKQASKKEPRK